MKRKGKLLFYKVVDGNTFILLGQRQNKGETFWWLPGGGAEPEETVFEGAVRELSEELYPLDSLNKAVNAYVSSGKIPTSFTYKTSISENTVYFIKVEQEFEEVPKIKDEFDKLQWFDFKKFPDNMSREYQYLKPEIIKCFG